MKNKRILYTLLVPFLGLVTIQLCLHNPQTRELFTDIEKQENIVYGTQHQDDTETIEISLTDCSPHESIEIFYNARYMCPFSFTTMEVPVECSGVLQINNDSGQMLTVAVKSKSDNVKVTEADLHPGRGISTVCYVEIMD